MSAPDNESSGTPAPEDLLAVARLMRPHGLRGEIGGFCLAPEVLDFSKLVADTSFWVRRGGLVDGKIKVLSFRPHQTHLLFTFENVCDRTAAEALKGAELCLTRAELPDLPEGWFWESDLIGFKVEDEKLGMIGEVVALESVANQWSFTVKNQNGELVSIPWAKALVPCIDPFIKVIRTNLPFDFPGLS